MASEKTDIPRLVLEEEPSKDQFMALFKLDQIQRREYRDMLQAIIREGKRFAQTIEGKQIKEYLANSDLVRNGWILWNVGGLDFLLNDDDFSASTPSELWQQIWNSLLSIDFEQNLSKLLKDIRLYETVNSAKTNGRVRRQK